MMIASLLINSIRSALNALERPHYYANMKWQLKNLEFFVLCATKLNDDEQLRFDDGKVSTLKSLLQRIHDAIPSTPCNWDLVGVCLNFVSAITNLEKEIGHWYDNFSVSLPQPTFHEVMEIIDSVLENLDAISHSHFDRLQPPTEVMIAKITFLRNFILFATLRSIEPRQLLENLLLHIQTVAVHAAHISYICMNQRYPSYIYMHQRYDMEPNVPVLLQMIKMVDPQVDETYTQALTSFKLSTKLHFPIPDKDHNHSVIMKDFIDSLLRNLWERLHTDTLIVISTPSELQLVDAGLRLLRTMLKELPNKFDKKIGELTRVAICDAGVIIFSLYKKDMEIFVPASDSLHIVKGKHFSIPDFLQKITYIRQRVEGKDLSIQELLRIHGAREQVGGNKNQGVVVWINDGFGWRQRYIINFGDIKMMAFVVINSIRSNMNDMEWSDDDSSYKHMAKTRLKNLELFVRCARKLGNDAQLRFDGGKVSTLGSLLQRIHDALPASPYNWDLLIYWNFSRAIANLKKEIVHWYDTFSVSLQPPTVDEVMEIIDFVLKSIDFIFHGKGRLRPPSRELMEAMTEKMTFLRNFIRFATLRSVEPRQLLDNLLVHIQAVAVDAARTFYICNVGEDDEEVEPNIPMLLQMIKMVDPQVDETYTQALTSFKLSTKLHFPIPDKDHDHSVIMKDFIDSLIGNLWERLHTDTLIVIFTNSELELVVAGLRLLRTMLKEQPNKDKKIGELTRVAICDAGVVIFSLYRKDMEIFVPAADSLHIVKGKDFSIQDFMQKIIYIRQSGEEKDLSIQKLRSDAREPVGGNKNQSVVGWITEGSDWRRLKSHQLQFSNQISAIKMMASLVIKSIRSALNDLEKSEDRNGYYQRMANTQLKNLELFVLCARKLDNDAQVRFDAGKVSTLGSLLQRIHDALPASPYNWDSIISWDFSRAIAKLKKEIVHWYDTFSVSLQPPTVDEVMEIIDFVLENIDFIFLGRGRLRPPRELMEAMTEKITFLRNFIRFATMRSVEPRQLLDNLLVHIQAVAVDAAHTFYICIVGEHNEEVKLNIPMLLQMIKMVDPQVDETYTQALTSSKLSTKVLSPIPDKDHGLSIIMKDFIDSLLQNLWDRWDRLHADTIIVISTKSKLQVVDAGLRLLRTMLKEQPNKFDQKIGELTRVALCDLGVIIFSLYQKDMEIFVPASNLLQILKGKDFSILDWVQRIGRIRQRVEGKDLSIQDLRARIPSLREQVVENDLPRTNELGFIDFVLENLLGMTSSKASYGFQSQFQMIHDELCLLRNSLVKIEEVRNEEKDLEALWNAGVKVAYRVEFLIDQLVFGYFQDSSSTSFDSTVEDILKEVKRVNSNIHPASYIKVKKVSMTPNPVPIQNRAPVADEIVGLHDDIESITNRLIRGSKQLKMVAIVGMPGIGKTTLATKVFNHPSVTLNFQVRLQCCVSQLFHKKQLLLELSNLVDPNTSIEMSEHDLTEKLWRHLKGKRYLIFLDDVWDIEAWDSLRSSFPDDHCESRILVTSRNRDAVPKEIPDDDIFSPRLLTEDQSWELLRKKLPPRIEWSLALDELGKQIAANCKGLPLTVIVVAGLLANMEPQGWKVFGESISSVSGDNHCMNIVELSYKHLPGHLKQCFLYFGLFPEDHEVSVKRLIRLWIAEGFVCKTESKRLEDAARDYLMDLVGRSLVIVSKKGSRGGVKTCRIHDLLHDFCSTKAKDENFFRLLKGGYDEFLFFEEPGYMRRLCVHSVMKHFEYLMPFCPRLHSLLFFDYNDEPWDYHDISSFIISRYRRLRVLDIEWYSLSRISNEIGLVLQLKYLSVRADISHIPSSIGSLTNLETFILYSDGRKVSVPHTFWNLHKLRHFVIRPSGFRLEVENLENFPELCELQSYRSAIIAPGESIERLVRKFPNICRLGCYFVSEDSEDSNEIETLKLDYLSQLESLDVWVMAYRGPRYAPRSLEFYFPINLRKLSLMGPLLRPIDVSMIGKLPILEVLKLMEVKFEEKTWEIVEGEFLTLRFLRLDSLRIVRWTAASDYQFLCLEKLVLRHCDDLKEIPCCFKSIDTLEMVNLEYCCEYVCNFFKRIRDEQTELGNSFLNIQISKPLWK